MSWLILYKLCTSADTMLDQSTPNENKYFFLIIVKFKELFKLYLSSDRCTVVVHNMNL